MDLSKPLAYRMRPKTLEEYVGQEHILGKDKILYRTIKADRLSSIILFGPPGCGKTSLARVISETTKYKFYKINAVTSGVSDIKRVIEQNKDEELYHFRISDDYKILYLDVSKEILNSQSTFTAKMSSLMTLTYDSEIYHVLNGTKNWSLQIIVTDMETGKELENIKFPEEDYNLSIETWDNL